MHTIFLPLLGALHLNNIGVFKGFPSVSPPPPPNAYPVRVLVSQVVFSPPTHPPPPSLPASPAENDSQSIFTLWSSPLLAHSTHFPSLSNHSYSPVFNSLLLLSLSPCPCECFIRTFKLCLEEAHLHDGQMEKCSGI